MESKLKRTLAPLGLITIVLLVAISVSTCKPGKPKERTVSVVKSKKEVPFINSPIREANIPYASYTVNTGKETELTHSSGTKIRIPADAFVDKDGIRIKGEVTILYREMHTPWDILVSGIPMTFVKDSVRYHFESAGMFDIKGMAKDRPVFIAPGKKLHVKMVSNTPANRFQNYYLDTVNKRWIELDKSKVVTVHPEVKTDLALPAYLNDVPVPPVKPRRADSVVNILNIHIENRKDFPEFDPFEKLKFEVLESHGQFKAGNAPLQCSLPEVVPCDSAPGCYYLRAYVKGEKQYRINWLIRPAYEGFDYEKAMKIYAEQQKQYREKLRLLEEQKKLAEKEEKRLESISQIYREIEFSKFGIYNCDNPLLIEWKEFQPSFITVNGEKLKINLVMIIDNSINGVIRFDLEPGGKIRLNPDANQKIIGVAEDASLYAANSKEFTTENVKLKLERFKDPAELKKFVSGF